MIGKILGRTFWVFYDNLFKGVILNLITFGILFGLFIIFFMKIVSVPLTILSIGLAWHLLAPAELYYWSKVIRTEESKGMFPELLDGLKMYSFKGLVVFMINAAFFCVAFLSINFYRNNAGLKVPFLILGGVGIWLVLVFLLMQIFVMPIMVLDEKRRVLVSYKKAAIMLMSNPLSTFMAGSVIGYLFLIFYPILVSMFGSQPPVLLALAALFPIFLMPFLTFTYVMLMQMNSAVLVYEKHGVYPSLKEIWDERTAGNIFRPWERK